MLPKPRLTGGEGQPGRRSKLGEYIPVEHRTMWPITVAPVDNEPVHSWLARASHRYGMTPRQFIQALGVPNEQTPDRSLTQLAKYWNEVTPLLGLEPSTYRNLNTAVTDKPLRYCPKCLAENSAWTTDWNQHWVLACHTHDVLLHDTCPTCEQPQWRSASWFGRTSPPYRCTERVTAPTETVSETRKIRPWCNTDLRETPTQPAPPGLHTAQHTLLQALHEQETAPNSMRAFGPWDQVSNHQHAHAITTLITYASEQPSGIEGQVATLLEAWSAYTDLNSPTGNGDNLRRLFADISQTGILGPPRTARNSDLGPIVVASLLKTHEDLSANKQLAFRTARTWPAHPADWSNASPDPQLDHRQSQLPEHSTAPLSPPAEWIPQTLWPRFGAKGDNISPGARAIQSMLLLHLGRTSKWSHLALELGLPASLQHQARAQVQRLASNAWPEQLTQLEHQFERLLSNPPPINYRIRRVIGAETNELKAALSSVTGSEPTQALLRHFWESLTGGDISLGPPPLGINYDSTAYRMFVKRRRHFIHEYMPVFSSALNFLQKRHGMPAEPLIWSPPP